MSATFKLIRPSIAVCLFAFSGVLSAHAADMVPIEPATTHETAPIYSQTDETRQSWDGFYMGVRVGYDFDTTLKLKQKNPSIGYDVTSELNPKSLIAGLFLGFNAEIADNFVAGIDVGGNYIGRDTIFGFLGFSETDFKGNNDSTNPLKGKMEGATLQDKFVGPAIKVSETYEADLSIRLGYSITPDFMPYVIGGGAAKRVTIERAFDKKTDSEFLFGWNLGAGVDIKLSENTFVRGEYRHIKYTDKQFDLEGAAGLIGAPTYEVGSTVNRASVGIGYRF